jgi:hypothetical protein
MIIKWFSFQKSFKCFKFSEIVRLERTKLLNIVEVPYEDEVLTLSAIIRQNCLENEHSSLQHSGIKDDGKILFP